MDSLHADIFGRFDEEAETDLCDQEPEPEPYCTKPRRTCTRCQKLGRRCFRCRLSRVLNKDEELPAKSSLESAVGSKPSQRRDQGEASESESAVSTEETPPPPTRTRSQATTRNTTIFSRETATTFRHERTYRSHPTYFDEHDSWYSSALFERTREPRTPQISHTRNRSRHYYNRYTETIPSLPIYHRSSAEFEVLKTCYGWQLLSTKCHVEKYVNGHVIHYHECRNWTEPFTEPSHCETCRRIQEAPEYVAFKDVDVTYIKKAPHCGYAEEIWAAMIGKPLPMRGSVIRNTSHHRGPFKVQRTQLLGPGKLMASLYSPAEVVSPVKPLGSLLSQAVRSIFDAILYWIFGIDPEEDNSHEID